MPTFATKLYIPPLRRNRVHRPRLIERLHAGLASGRVLTLISAAAGFGKTTLLSEWIAVCERPVAWLSLDADDSNPTRFLTYLIAALQTIQATIGAGVLATPQAPQLPPLESMLTALINDLVTIPDPAMLILDDYHYHAIDAQAVDAALALLLEHLPPQLHLVIATREDPALLLQAKPIRSFLLQSSLLDRLCAPLCNALIEREDGREMLNILERSNLFLIPLDDQRQWYRYHHLFAEVLQTYLRSVWLSPQTLHATCEVREKYI